MLRGASGVERLQRPPLQYENNVNKLNVRRPTLGAAGSALARQHLMVRRQRVEEVHAVPQHEAPRRRYGRAHCVQLAVDAAAHGLQPVPRLIQHVGLCGRERRGGGEGGGTL